MPQTVALKSVHHQLATAYADSYFTFLFWFFFFSSSPSTFFSWNGFTSKTNISQKLLEAEKPGLEPFQSALYFFWLSGVEVLQEVNKCPFVTRLQFFSRSVIRIKEFKLSLSIQAMMSKVWNVWWPKNNGEKKVCCYKK